MLQIGIREKICLLSDDARPVGGWGCYKLVSEKKYVYSVSMPDLLVVGDVTNWYQSHGFNTEPGWAMLVEVETKVSE
jgi:hypothetical protein